MSYPIPTLQEAEELLVAAFRAHFPDRNVGARRSYHRRRLQVLAMALTELHAHIASAMNDLMPDTATGTMAERWGKLVGTGKKAATPARKDDAFRVVGLETTPIVAGTTLFHPPTGLRFQITEDDVVPASGEVDVAIAGIDVGSKTRLEKGEILEFEEVPAGLEPRGELQKDLDEDGFDAEQESKFKRRYLDAFGEPSAGGNDADYRRWMNAMAGIAQSFVYPNRAGRGTLDVVALHTGELAERVLTQPEADAVVAALRLLGPSQVVAEGGSIRHLTVLPDTQRIEMLVEPIGQPQWEFDWVDQVAPVVQAWNAGTRVLTFVDDRPASMKAGDRMCIRGVASAQKGEVLVIEALVNADAVKLEAAPIVAPVATDIVYAGGPLTAIIRDALLAHVKGDDLYAGDDGPIPGEIAEESNVSIFELRVLAEGLGPANPGGKYGDSWNGDLLRSLLQSIAQYPRGVRKANCLVPAADYIAADPKFPDDQSIGLIIAGEVLVRRSW